MRGPGARALFIALPSLLVTAASAELGAGTQTSVVFSYNGTDGTDGSVQTFVVPDGVTQLTVVAQGAAGGRNGYGSLGGNGARVTGRLTVTPGEILRIRVGGRPSFNNPAALGGFNGGGAPNVQGLPETIIPAGGGGASDVRQGGTTLRFRVIVAGGGGGAGAPASQDAQSEALPDSGGVGGDSGSAGGPGGLIGPLFDASQGGDPGTASEGGFGGQPGFSNGMCGFQGNQGERARGGGGIGGINYSGGGGGGYYGGGSGASGPCEFAPEDDYVGGAGGGGGGSSLVPPGGTLIDGFRDRHHGRVVIRYQAP